MPSIFRISQTHSIVLDLVRFLCSQGVVIGHTFFFLGINNTFINPMSSYCVLMFFVLSGFLISHSLQQNILSKPGYSFRHFFRHRFFRIYPPFLGALVLVFVVDMLHFHFTGEYHAPSIYAFDFIVNILQLQDYPVALHIYNEYKIDFFFFHYFGTDLPLWTVSIEWWLYMFYGYLTFYLLRNKSIKVVHVLLILLLAISPLYYIFMDARMEKGLTLYWFLGIAITYAQPGGMLKSTLWFMLNLLMVIAGMCGYSFWGYEVSILIFFLGMLMLVQTTAEEKPTFNKLLGRISKYLSGYSYSIYLIHYPILYFATAVFHPTPSASNFILLLLIINIIAFAFAQVFERPSRKLKLIYENYRSNKN